MILLSYHILKEMFQVNVFVVIYFILLVDQDLHVNVFSRKQLVISEAGKKKSLDLGVFINFPTTQPLLKPLMSLLYEGAFIICLQFFLLFHSFIKTAAVLQPHQLKEFKAVVVNQNVILLFLS